MKKELLKVKNPYIIYVNGLGDHLLTLPTIRALAKIFDGNLSLVCKAGYKKLFFDGIDFKSVIEVPFKVSGENYIFDIPSLCDRIADCDFLISLIPWENEYIEQLLKQLHPKHSMGFSEYFEHSITIGNGEHSSDSTFKAAKFFESELDLKSFSYPPVISEANYRVAKQVRNTLPANCKLLVLHGDTQGEKVWPNQRYFPFLDNLMEKYSELIVLVIGQQFLSFTRCKYRDRIIREFFNIPIDTTFALIKEADYYLGVDSCFLHMADLMLIPSVGLFGPTSQEEWGFKWTRHIHIKAPNADMCEIKPDMVYDAMTKLIEETVNAGL